MCDKRAELRKFHLGSGSAVAGLEDFGSKCGDKVRGIHAFHSGQGVITCPELSKHAF